MRKMGKIGAVGLGFMTFALCASLGAGTAFGARTVQFSADTADWSIPTTSMTNTVWKDADGNLVDANTEGATQYKVLTTWAEAWSTSGSDYLGMSNSAYYGNGGNGNAVVTDFNTAQKLTTVGVWATSANESPNAYNWNTFYNLYQKDVLHADASAYSDWACATSGSNKSPEGGSNWSSEAGVWTGFKYRPDVVTTNNNLSADAAKSYISYIQDGKYAANATDAGTNYAPAAVNAPEGYSLTDVNGISLANADGAVLCIKGDKGTLTYTTKQGKYDYTDNGDGTGNFKTDEGYIVVAKLVEQKSQRGTQIVPGAASEIKDSEGNVVSTLATASSYDSSYYVYNDENYNPDIVSYDCMSLYSFSESFYELAAAGEQVIKDTADYAGLKDGEALTWKTVNELPRSSRYSETPTECALNYEKLVKGSVYYALAKFSENPDLRQKVAIINTEFGSSTTLSDNEVKIAVIDYTENISGPADGTAGILPLVVDQLGACEGDSLEPADTTGKQSASTPSSTSDLTLTYQYYVATADDLATCDAIYMPESTKTATEWQEWIEKYATTTEGKEAAKNINYVVNGMPCATNGSNMTVEKTLYSAMALDCIYPNLFPNMQLSTFWCDAIYHLDSSSLASAMSWIYSTSPLADGAELTTLGKDYSRDAVLAKFETGYNYFQNSKTTDSTISRILANKALDGTTTFGTGDNAKSYNFDGFGPSQTWIDSETEPTPVKEDIKRDAGEDAFGTMTEIVEEGWADGSCDTVILATFDGYWDALSASGLAGLNSCPVLMTKGDSLTAETKAQIERLGAKNVIIAGGTSAISTTVANQVKEITGSDPVRAAGKDAIGTSIEVYKAGKGSWGDTCIIATVHGYYDALAASPYAYAQKAPIFLANDDGSISAEVQAAITDGGFKNVIIVGGNAVVSEEAEKALETDLKVTVEREAGENCFETSAAMAQKCVDDGMGVSHVAFATGLKGYYDALCGGALCGKYASPLLLVDDGNNDPAVEFVSEYKNKIYSPRIFGGTAAVSTATEQELAAALK